MSQLVPEALEVRVDIVALLRVDSREAIAGMKSVLTSLQGIRVDSQ